MRLNEVFFFLLFQFQYQRILGLFEISNIIEFLTSNVTSGSQFEFIFSSDSELHSGNTMQEIMTRNLTHSLAIITLSEQLTLIKAVGSGSECLSLDEFEKRTNFRILVFNMTQNSSNSIQTLTSIFSAVRSIRFKSNLMFIILWPSWLDSTTEIPKLISIESSNQSTPTSSSSPFLDLESDVYLLHEQNTDNPNNPKFLLTELYQIKSTTPIIQVNITGDTTMTANVSLSQESVLIYELLRKAHRRNNFQGVEVRAAAQNETDFEFEAMIGMKADEPEFISGEAVGIYRNLRDATKFKEKAVLGTGYASLYATNGSLSGMGAQVWNGEADISISFSEMVPYRIKHLTFLHPVSDEKLYVYFRQPASNAFRDIYLHAFSPTLWLVYLILWFVLCASVMIFIWVKKHIQDMNVEEDLVLLYEFAIWAVASVAQQGWYTVPRSISVAIVAMTGMMTAFILYTAFCGSLVSILSLPVVPITSIQNILDNHFVIYGEHLSIAVADLLKNLEEKKIGKLGRKPFLSPHDAMTRLIGQPNTAYISPVFAFYLPLLRTEYYNDTVLCSTVSGIPLHVSPAKAGMFLRKGSPFKEIFNAKILHIIETGIRRRLIRRYKQQSSFTCMGKDQGRGKTPKDPMEIKDVITAIALLLMGFILSGTIFLIEKLIHYYFKSKEFHLAIS